MKLKVSESERETLDYMVVMAEWIGHHFSKEERFIKIFLHQNRTGQGYCYSRDWAQGGPIIERERIEVRPYDGKRWIATDNLTNHTIGPNPLVAAMRCYVISKLGNEVDIPESLVEGETQ